MGLAGLFEGHFIMAGLFVGQFCRAIFLTRLIFSE
jgi:hypothetical protein